jgi:hypothetical protein
MRVVAPVAVVAMVTVVTVVVTVAAVRVLVTVAVGRRLARVLLVRGARLLLVRVARLGLNRLGLAVVVMAGNPPFTRYCRCPHFTETVYKGPEFTRQGRRNHQSPGQINALD